jgi:TonB-dependent SusC/RagA subfamily outer membrane receptor
VNNKKADISQIDKYLDNSLDAHSMHKLERQAQDDPFLMDALEGYESTGNNQKAQLNELSNRLKQRVDKKPVRVIPWRILAIAASVLIALTFGGLWVFNNKPPKPQQITEANTTINTSKIVQSPEVKETPTTVQRNTPLAVLVPHHPLRYRRFAVKKTVDNSMTADSNINMLSEQLDKVNSPVAAVPKKDDAPLNEMLVMDFATKKKTEANNNGVLKDVGKDDLAYNKKANGQLIISGQPAASTRVVLRGGNSITGDNQPLWVVDGIPVVNAHGQDKSIHRDSIQALDYGNNAGGTLNPDDIESIKVLKGTNAVALYGSKAANGAILVITKKGKKKTDSLNALAENNPRFNKGTISLLNKTVKAPLPQNGWANFEKYLDNAAISPDGEIGVVKLSFNVGADGSLSDFKIKTDLSAAADQKAIDLIKNGPGWSGSSDGEVKNITVTARFHKAQ